MFNPKPFKGCPELAWILAKKTTGSSAYDCCICVEGKKGKGKSMLSLTLAEQLSKYLSMIKGGVPEDYFNIHTHMVSVERDGALDLLSSPEIKRKNNIFILDDVSVQWSSRNSMSIVNRTLNDLLTVARVYRSILICNLVARSTSDLILRNLTDYVARIESKNVKTGEVIFRFYATDVKTDGKELLKFLTWRDPQTGKKYRIKHWIGHKPSDYLIKEYMKMRQKNTDIFLDSAVEKVRLHRENQKKGGATGEKPDDPRIAKYKDQVGDLFKLSRWSVKPG
jgi:hypothetical protein